MSLLRNFTIRRQKPEGIQISSPVFIGRAASQRNGRPIVRSQISSPVALISTSNVMLNDAELIAGTTPLEMVRSPSSGSPSIASSHEDNDSSNSSIRSHGTLTDASSIDEAPSPTSCEPEPNHLSCYFKPAVDTQSSSPSLSRAASVSNRQSTDSPDIPTRVASHSKKAHESLHRKRSIQRVLSPPPSRDGRSMSTESFNPSLSAFVEAPVDAPFVNELAQLDEAAEEFGQVVQDAEATEDAMFMKSYDLAQFSASDYLSEIQDMIYSTFTDDEINTGSWI